MRYVPEGPCGAPKSTPCSRVPSDPRGLGVPSKKPLSFEAVHAFLRSLFAEDLHAKRVLSLAGATLGVIQTASLAVAMIGQGLALARGRLPKHATKQVDRLLSNPGIEVEALLAHWVPYVVGARSSITVAMDWTEFAADGQATVMLALLTEHGRATPLVWLTVDTATLKGHRNDIEYRVLVRLAEMLPAEVRVRIVADRGFGDHKLYRVLTEELRFDFVIRFRGNITVTADGETRSAAEWVGAGGRARVLRGATVTAERYEVGTVVCVQAKDMKQPWCLAASGTDEPARALINLYAKRWSIECGFRDSKDIRFGMGMGAVHVSTPDRRDRLWLLNAFAVVPLTLLGAAGEALGYDRHLRTNTAKRRTHSLLRQGHMLYELIPTMPEHRLQPLIEGFATMLAEQPVFAKALGTI
jgi:Transposase DDE domain